MSNFTIADFDLSTLGSSTFESISCKVKGYWSRDSITIYIRRDFSGDPRWNASINYGSGGRDTAEVESDSEAVRYFAQALVAMADLADELMAKAEVLEGNYQRQKEVYAAAARAEKEAKEAAIATDPILGSEKAKDLVMQLLTARNAVANMYRRGEARPINVSVSTRNKTTFYINGNRIARSELVMKLAESSVRTSMVEA